MIGIGIDAVEIDRFRRVLARTPGVARRLFTEGERAYGARFKDPAPRLAARFAAKEATMKVLRVGDEAVPGPSIEIRRSEGGAPTVLLHGPAAAIAAEHGIADLALSFTHEEDYAGAVVVAELKP